MRGKKVWGSLLGLGLAVVEDVRLEAAGELVVTARPKSAQRRCCGICGTRCARFDHGEGRRRWRALDLGTTIAFVEAQAPRVSCPVHGVTVARVPWARHDSRFTRGFEDQTAWLAVHAAKKQVAELMRVAWRTVGAICERVADDQAAGRDLFDGLSRIGIDEISRRRGRVYLVVVVCHDTGRLVWAGPGRSSQTVATFFSMLGDERCQQIRLVSCDMAGWIAKPVAEHCPDAVRCVDPFHVVQLATDALDDVRRDVWNDARRAGQQQAARDLKGARFALWKNPEDLTRRQRSRLASIQHTNKPLHRAYLLKEQLRQIYRLPAKAAIELLDTWLKWARRCRLAPFVKLARTLTEQRQGIAAAIEHKLSNALVESVNTRVRLLTRRAFGFRDDDALIALTMLALGGLCPPLPGRSQ